MDAVELGDRARKATDIILSKIFPISKMFPGALEVYDNATYWTIYREFQNATEPAWLRRIGGVPETILIFLLVLGFGFFIGVMAERRESLEGRFRALKNVPSTIYVYDTKTRELCRPYREGETPTWSQLLPIPVHTCSEVTEVPEK